MPPQSVRSSYEEQSIKQGMKQSKYYFWIGLIITGGIFLRFFLLSNQSLWYDEGWSLSLSDGATLQDNLSFILNREAGDKYQPLYYLVLFYWRSIFGDSEFALRSLSVLVGIGSIVAVFFTALRLYGKKHALWSTLLISFSSFCIYYSQDARAYAFLLFLASLQVYCFSQVLSLEEKNVGIEQVLFWILTAVGVFGSILSGIFSAALALSHLAVYRNLKQWFLWWLPATLFSLPVILFYISSPAASDPTSTSVTRSGLPVIQNAAFVVYGMLVGVTYGPSTEQLRGENKLAALLSYSPQLLILLLTLGVIFFCLAIVLLKYPNGNKYQRANHFFATLFVVSYVLAFLFAVATKINWLPRHSFYLYIPITLLLPSIITHKYKRRTKFQSTLNYAQLAVALLVILNIYSTVNYYFNQEHWKDDYRSATQYLLENRDASAESILLWGTPRLMSYYGDTRTIDGREIKRTDLAEKVGPLTNNASTVFLAINREFYWNQGNKNMSVEEAMGNEYLMKSKASFPNFTVYQFDKK